MKDLLIVLIIGKYDCGILKTEGDSINYVYDYGDNWEHEIKLLKIKTDIKFKKPICIAGERSCPPDDCGGVSGFEGLLKILKNPQKQEYKEMMEWIGYKYNPENIDIDSINKKLKRKDFGCTQID